MRKEIFTSNDRVWRFWLLLVVTSAVLTLENFGDFSTSVPSLLKSSGGLPILDMRFWYTPVEAYRLFDALGQAGRAENRLLYLSVDIVIPLLSSMLLWSTISRGALRKWRYFALLGGSCDYLENVDILILLASYPTHLDSLVTVTALFTQLKFVFYGLGIVLAIIGLILKPLRRKSPVRSADVVEG